MKLIINNTDIDFSIENEKTAGDLIENVLQFLESQNQITSSIMLNKKKIEYTNKGDFDPIDIDEIETLEFITIHQDSLTIEKASINLNNIRLLNKAAASKSDFLIKDTQSHFASIKKDLLQLFPSNTTIITGLESILSSSPFNYEAIETTTNILLMLLNDMLEDIQFPENSFKSIVKSLSDMKPNLENISVNIQTNNEKTAYNTIITFSDLTQRLLNVVSRLTVSDELIENLNTMKEFLSEITVSMENSDNILTGDLFEYEIIPCIEYLESNVDFS